MHPGVGQSGQWVRTRTEADTKAFVSEKLADQERSMHTGRGTLILTAVVVLFFVACVLYGWLT